MLPTWNSFVCSRICVVLCTRYDSSMKEVQDLPTFQTTVVVSNYLLIPLFKGPEHTLWNFPATVRRRTHWFFMIVLIFCLPFSYYFYTVYKLYFMLLRAFSFWWKIVRRIAEGCVNRYCASLLWGVEICDIWDNFLTASFNNLWTLKFSFCHPVIFFTAVNHCSGPLRRKTNSFGSTGSKAHVQALWLADSIHFYGFCVFAVINSSKTRKSLVGFWSSDVVSY